MVASHTAVPLGTAKWLVRATPTPETLPLGTGHTQLMSPTQGQAYIIGETLAPAISKHPRAFLYGWLPLSDASGIILSILDIPNVLLLYNVCFIFENLSNNIRILTPN